MTTPKDLEDAEDELDTLLACNNRKEFIAALASLIAQTRNETLEAAAAIAEQRVVQKPICSTRVQNRKRAAPSLTRQAIAQEIRSMKTKETT